VVTGVYIGADEQLAAIERILAPVSAGGGSAFFVQLTCEREVWLARIGNELRRAQDKLTDPVRATSLFEGRDPFGAIPLTRTLQLDITHTPLHVAAAPIVEHYNLDALNGGRVCP
jgi:hypothetical protein